ncbi:MAG TPA: dienelactone hydrolase family protein [Candidatus Dormibacteraeota bacterium]|nr:dienelactone hydrolase family protein [Candidatus Dormibacteraeota bacterium]
MAQTQSLNLPVSDGTSMGAFIARPDGDSAAPGILVFQEAFGVNAHIRDICGRLAGEGFIALAPELYHRTGTGVEIRYDDFTSALPHAKALTDAGLEADVRAAHKALAAEPRLDQGRMVSIGFCMGGRISFLADALLSLRASVSFYGGGIAPNPMGPGILGRAKDLHAPILMFWGGLDKHIGIDQTRAVVDALREAKKPYANVEFSDADHGFFCDARPSYNPLAAKHAWGLTLAFLRTHLEG